MPSPKTLVQLLVDQLRELYEMEIEMAKMLPEIVRAATNDKLRQALKEHLNEAGAQVERLNAMFERLGVKAEGRKSLTVDALLDDVTEVVILDGPHPIVDASLIRTARRIEHHEIAEYSTARSVAEALGENEVAHRLDRTLREELMADGNFGAIAPAVLSAARAAGLE